MKKCYFSSAKLELIKKIIITLLIFGTFGCTKKEENKKTVDDIKGTYVTENQELYITIDQDHKEYQMKHVIGSEIYEGTYYIEDEVIQFTGELNGYKLYPSDKEIILESESFKVNLTLVSSVPIVTVE